jgi:hypothetical protein
LFIIVVVLTAYWLNFDVLFLNYVGLFALRFVADLFVFYGGHFCASIFC